VHRVERRLVAGIGVNGRHHALFEADGIIQSLGDRRKAIGGARGVGDDQVILGQLLVVHAIDDCQVCAVGRRGDENALGAGGQKVAALSRAVKMPVHSIAMSTPSSPSGRPPDP